MLAIAFVLLVCGYGLWNWVRRDKVSLASGIGPEAHALPSQPESVTARPVEPVIEVDHRVPEGTPASGKPPSEDVGTKLARLMHDVHLLAADEGWKEANADSSPQELKLEVDRIEDLIYEATKDEFEYRFEIGMGAETLSTDGQYRCQDFDPTSVYWVRMYQDGRVVKITLPREEFPEVYALKARSAWLRDRLQAQSGAVYAR